MIIMKKFLYILASIALVSTTMDVAVGMDVVLENTTSESTYLDKLPNDVAHLIMDHNVGAGARRYLAYKHGITKQMAEKIAVEFILSNVEQSNSWENLLDYLLENFEKFSLETIGGEMSKAHELFKEKVGELVGCLIADLSGDALLMRKCTGKQVDLIKALYPHPERSSLFVHASPLVQRFLRNFCKTLYDDSSFPFITQESADYCNLFTRIIHLRGPFVSPASSEISPKLSISDKVEDINSPISLPLELDKLTLPELHELKRYLKLRHLQLNYLKQFALNELNGLTAQLQKLKKLSLCLIIIDNTTTAYLVGKNYQETHSIIQTMRNACNFIPHKSLMWKYLGPYYYCSFISFICGYRLYRFAFNKQCTVISKKLGLVPVLFSAKSEEEAKVLIGAIQNKFDEHMSR